MYSLRACWRGDRLFPAEVGESGNRVPERGPCSTVFIESI